jgi:glucose/mannose-6-phosphate isomerase
MIHRLGYLRDYTNDVEEAARVMECWQEEIEVRVPIRNNPAKKLANQIAGRLPLVYGSGFLIGAANRWKTQFNENAKYWAFFEMLPELNHNAVVGYSLPQVVRENSLVLMLRSHLDSERIQARWDVTREVLDRAGVIAHEVHGRGESALAQALSLIHFGDYVSFYLATLNDVDPTPVRSIAFLKKRLAELDLSEE